MGGGHGGHGVDAGAGVPLEGAQGCVPALGHQQGQWHPFLGEVGDGRVPQLVRVRPGAAAEKISAARR